MSDPMLMLLQGTHLMLGQGADELVYVIAVLIFIAVGWVVERVKSKMAEAEQQRREGKPSPPRPRPQIPRVSEGGEAPGRARPAVPPALERPRPVPPRPVEDTRRAQPHVPSTFEDRRPVIRTEPSARPRHVQRQGAAGPTAARRPAPARPQPAAPPPSQAQEPETWSRLAKFGDSIRAEAEAKQLGQIKPAEAVEAAIIRGRVGAASFRNLTRADLQRAFVLKEILEPPLALRDS
jgi:hypothetical protein